MNKSILFYITHKWNDNIQYRLDYLIEDVGNIVDVILYYNKDLCDMIPQKYLENSISYDNNIITNNLKHGCPDPFLALKHTFKYDRPDILENYEAIYLYEYDIIYNGSLKNLIIKCESENADLIGAYIKNISLSKEYWAWENHYYIGFNKYHFMPMFKYILKSLLCFCKISTDAIKEIILPKYDSIIDSDIVIYELYIPSIIYERGGKIKSISKENNEFDWIDIVNKNTYNSGLYFYHKEEAIQALLDNETCILAHSAKF